MRICREWLLHALLALGLPGVKLGKRLLKERIQRIVAIHAARDAQRAFEPSHAEFGEMARIVIFLQKRAAVEKVRRFSVARQVCFVKHKERLVEAAIHFELDDETERLAKKEEAFLPDARLCHAPLQALYGLSYPFIHGRPSR